MSERDCKHGQLARSCNICELETDLADARAKLAAWEPTVRAAVAWRHNESLSGQSSERLVIAVDALPKEHRP